MEKEDLLMMKPYEITRLHLIHQALERKISQRQAAEIAGLSSRQMRRLMKRIRHEGDRGILHRQRGRPSNRRIAEGVKQKVLRLYQQHYGDFGPTLASEKLRERHRVTVHAETLRLWLRQAQLPYRRRKARPHRQWRPRRSCFGTMVQMDGSEHDWLEGRGPKLVLMGVIDDATNTVAARFYDHEGTLPALGPALWDSGQCVSGQTYDLSIPPPTLARGTITGFRTLPKPVSTSDERIGGRGHSCSFSGC